MAKIKGLLFFVALALLFFIGGLVNAVKVKAQDPAPAYKTAVQFADAEASLTLKSVNEKIQDAYSIKQENKNFSNSENLSLSSYETSKLNVSSAIVTIRDERKIYNSKKSFPNTKDAMIKIKSAYTHNKNQSNMPFRHLA